MRKNKKLLHGILIIVAVVGIVLINHSISKGEMVNVQWQVADGSLFTPSVTDMWRDGVVFQWHGDTYNGSNIKGTYIYNGPNIENRGKPVTQVDFFKLKKDDVLVLYLDEDKNEMRFFRFVDCEEQLCIFGTRMGKARDPKGANPDIDLVVVLWPSRKRLLFSNPCRGRQVGNFDLDQLSATKFLIRLECPDWAVRAYKIPKYYQGEANLEEIIMKQ